MYAIDPNYAKGIFNLLPESKKKSEVKMDEIAEASKEAHMVNKDPSFYSADKGKTFMGMPYKSTLKA